ncbi:intradiol ring-cleavage dioxygenase [Pengzhenrongella sp.]|uniref:intradiol ring-cleavage dioxygenase n=1 Tax=Pengzhenrongella sp. TaxID=2888820 RepID=UPI002F92C102
MKDRPAPRWLDNLGHEIDEEDRGLVYDVRTLIDRRRVLGLFGGATAAGLLAACGVADSSSGTKSASISQGTPTSESSASTDSASTDSASTDTSAGEVTEVPDETGGPYPGDGSNGVNVLDDSGIVRKDIRSSFGSSTTTAAGVPLAIALTVRDAASGDVVKGAAVYLWHCDRDGGYSLYSQGLSVENYLRGVQQLDASGTATFTSIYPACYPGRWPHIHFEVYKDVATAVVSGPIVKTSQIALPKETCELVYATSGYEQSVSNLASVSLASDNVFGDDGGIHQIATMTGDPTKGYTAALTIGV